MSDEIRRFLSGFVSLRPDGTGWASRSAGPVSGAAELVKFVTSPGLEDKPIPVSVHLLKYGDKVRFSVDDVQDIRDSEKPVDKVLQLLESKIVRYGYGKPDTWRNFRVKYQALGFETENPDSPPFGNRSRK